MLPFPLSFWASSTPPVLVSLLYQYLNNLPGTYTWTAPTGVTSIANLATYGAGGGGTPATVFSGGGGGGGGATSVSNVSVTAGNNYTVIVGVGGSGLAVNTGGTAPSGTSSSFNGQYTSTGGAGGTNQSATNAAGGIGTGSGAKTGGHGGSGFLSGGADMWSGGGGGGGAGAGGNGGNGTNDPNNNSSAPGGTGGNGFGLLDAGGPGQGSNSAAGGASPPPGGGGAGQGYLARAYAGGNGASGQVQFYYDMPATDYAVLITNAPNAFNLNILALLATSGSSSFYAVQYWNSTNVYKLSNTTATLAAIGGSQTFYVYPNSPGVDEITSLTANSCDLTSVDVSKLPAINTLSCASNSLTNAVLSAALVTLLLGSNQLATINLGVSPLLQSIQLNNNLFTALDFSSNTVATTLYLPQNSNLTTITGLQNNTQTNVDLTANICNFTGNVNVSTWGCIAFLSLDQNANLTGFTNFTALINLITFNASDCNLTGNLDFTAQTQLSDIDVSENANLTSLTGLGADLDSLFASNCGLTGTLDVSNTQMNIMNVSSNNLSAITFGSNCQFSQLNGSYNPNLTSLTLDNTVDSCEGFDFSNCGLTSITAVGYTGGISTSSTTAYANLSSNNLSAAAINAFFSSLATATNTYGDILDVSSNPGSGTCNPAIATALGYTVIQ